GTKPKADFALGQDGEVRSEVLGSSPVDSTGTLKADTWALSETNVAGYTASAWVCVGGTQNGSNITLGVGQEATCTITNDDIAPKDRKSVVKGKKIDGRGSRAVGTA